MKSLVNRVTTGDNDYSLETTFTTTSEAAVRNHPDISGKREIIADGR